MHRTTDFLDLCGMGVDLRVGAKKWVGDRAEGRAIINLWDLFVFYKREIKFCSINTFIIIVKL